MDQLTYQVAGLAHVLAQPIRQGLLCFGSMPLEFVEEDSSRAHQGEIARSAGVAHLAMVFSLGMITPVMLLDLDGPISSYQVQESLGIRLLGRKTGYGVKRLVGCLENFAPTQVLDIAVDSQELGYSCQSHRRAVCLQHPKATRFNSPVPLINGLSLRGEVRPAATAELWPTPWADYL